MQDFAYLRRLVEERLGEASLRVTHRDLEAQFKLLRYAEAEGQAALEEALRRLDAKNVELATAKVGTTKEIRRLTRERDAAHAQLHALYTSTSWRLTGPLRRVVRMLRGTRHAPARTAPVASAAPDDPYHAASVGIVARFGLDDLPPPPPLHMLLGSAALIRERIAAVPPRSAAQGNAARRFTIVTPYFAHLGFFGRCASSVARLMLADLAATGAPRVAWIVVNDDPSCPEARLRDLVPETIRDRVRILSDGRNRGIAAALNHGIAAAKEGWILLLDCDDAIEPEAVHVLNLHIAADPGCRYFS